MRLARRAAPDEIEVLKLVKQSLMRITDGDRIVWVETLIDGGNLRLPLESTNLHVLPELAVSAESCVAVICANRLHTKSSIFIPS